VKQFPHGIDLIRVLEVDIMVAKDRINLVLGHKWLYETLSDLIQGGKIDELASIKQVPQVQHRVYLVLLQVRHEHLFRELEEMMQKDRRI
jgi:hypothetical protein